jgi:enolase
MNSISPYSSISELYRNGGGDNSTKLLFTILNGGKDAASKVKFSKVYGILSP